MSNDEHKQPEAGEVKESSTGILITKNTRIGLLPGSLKFTQSGNEFNLSISLDLGLDMCSYWLQIAYEHLISAELSHTNLKESTDDDKLAFFLEREFLAGMQSIVASAITIDALHAAVKDRINISSKILETWNRNKLSRKKQIREVFRRGFSIDKSTEKQLWLMISDVIELRDFAVHPTAKLRKPVFYPEIRRHVEWRFEHYRFQNAYLATRSLLSAVIYFVTRAKEKYPIVQKYCSELSISIEPLVNKWEAKYGSLYSS